MWRARIMKKEYADAVYECWARGGDSDALDYSDVDDLIYEGYDGYEAGRIIARRQAQQPQQEPTDIDFIEGQEAMLEFHQEADLRRLERECKA